MPLLVLTEQLAGTLNRHGISRVSISTIISSTALGGMTADKNHRLFRQVFRVGDRHCLRPMSAPKLYALMRELQRVKYRPIRFFEVGSCFLEETGGARHNTEFTMLKLV